MTTKVMKAIKLIAAPLLVVFGLISCEGDIQEVGVGIVDNGIFELKQNSFNARTYNQNDLEVKANKLGQYLLGIYKNDDVGDLNASVVGQLTFPTFIDFGTLPSIDSVILNIPYQATKDIEKNSNGSPKWELDSIFGNQEIEYTLSVHELKTYLNTLDPTNPEESLDYFSDQTYLFDPVALYSGLFKPNKNDTVSYIQRKEIIIDENTMAHDIDTIKSGSVAPAIKLPLDTDYFTNNFLTNPAAFESSAAFVEFFNGLYIQATKVNSSDRPSIMSLIFANASMNIYYTNTIVNTDGEDVRTAQTAFFRFGGVTNNTYIRDYTASKASPFLENPNTINGDTRLFLNGAAGSFTILDLFVDEDLDELRANNWLLNEANLVFYVDQTADFSVVPDRLFLYNFEDSKQISDILIDGITGAGGLLERDGDGNPYKYEINITNYISRILNEDDPQELKQLAVKVFNTTDAPASPLDTNVEDYSWTPKGIIIHGNQSENIEKRFKLELIYTEKN